MTPYAELFERATGHRPYPYQERLATAPWPDLLDVPTGLGKSAAVFFAWLFRRGYRAEGERQEAEHDTPRRLVVCLPMRVLVEQQVGDIKSWLSKLGLLGKPGEGRVSVHTLMGGSDDVRHAQWTDYPEEEAVLVGTQDMLLSRALMRGYGMSRYQWPVHFALLHTDALWVFDEVQLMGAALPTTAQLEAFRRTDRFAPLLPTRTLWMSATQRPDWLATVDFAPHAKTLRCETLNDRDRAEEGVRRRLSARKVLQKADTTLDPTTRKQGAAIYIQQLAKEVLSLHRPGTQTIVIVNRVERAQALYEAVGKLAPHVSRLLLHARFRPAERRVKERQLRDRSATAGSGRIVIATQAIEAGVDISSQVLFSELAPWTSLVQRFGRCNRDGEYETAEVRWIDITDDADEAAPYSADALQRARERLTALRRADPDSLPAVEECRPVSAVLRQRDVLNLFNTDPDLAGYDVDVSPYIRDSGIPSLQVYWRRFDSAPGSDEATVAPEELCPVSIGQIQKHLKSHNAWLWDPLLGRFDTCDSRRLRPGMTLLLRATDGGYDPDLGFVPGHSSAVAIVLGAQDDVDRYESDRLTASGKWVGLTQHLNNVSIAAAQLCNALNVNGAYTEAILEAARMHDVGKAHPAFQHALRKTAWEGDPPPETLAPWAKSAVDVRLEYAMPASDGSPEQRRAHFRHELASTLAWLAHHAPGPETDLIAYLIAAHHGKVRMSLRPLPRENEPPDDRLFARGVWDGDALPAVDLGTRTLPPTTLSLAAMQLGDSDRGPSWTHRTQRLLDQYGPFRLAWLEALVRIADRRASARERKEGSGE